MNVWSSRVVAIGEAMIEMAVHPDGSYRRSVAGDTFNTAWHMAQVPNAGLQVGFLTAVGLDAVADAFVQELGADGLSTASIARVPNRNMGLYMIELDGVERSFQYWRENSAARLLAEDAAWLEDALASAGLIHLSGITLAILSPDARERLLAALTRARTNGARVSFDPNVRPRLWASQGEARSAMQMFLQVVWTMFTASGSRQLSIWVTCSKRPENSLT